MDSFDYVVEEEVEVVVPRIFKEEKPPPAPPTSASVDPHPHPPGDEVAEAAAAGGSGRGWLRDYVDRLASSASSSFNSLRFSGRWSLRYDSGAAPFAGAPPPDSWLWDLEDHPHHPHPPRDEGEESGFSSFYRWLAGV
ncbi:E3 ubiquitin-protein ligase ATL4 [Ananas comosus]|uniref:E3 ubiquitin-protein ligase ATL4 n=1 Tax=Ananas comosus TaxID=4615 RepID=A0A199UQ00_ANACO|nr:E3 ubiquitin-protein ligase ATL4 [Ananas comosus]